MAKSDKEIIRAVFIDGETYVPGQEDELEEAFDRYADKADARDEEFDRNKEIERLTKQGAIIGFGTDVDEEDVEELDSDRAATRKRNPHLLQDPDPVARGGKAPPSMEEVQRTPDSNVVEMVAAGGAEAHAKAGQEAHEGADKMADATAQATEDLEAAQVQQESEQVPPPDGSEEKPKKTRAKKSKAKKSTAKTAQE